jgi:ferredoxin-2, mitochondrial
LNALVSSGRRRRPALAKTRGGSNFATTSATCVSRPQHQISSRSASRAGSGMSAWGVVRNTVLRTASPRGYRHTWASSSAHGYSTLCRHHEADIRARKSAIRNHIRALEKSRRRFSTSPHNAHGHLDPPKPGQERKVTFIDKDGDDHTFEVADGDNLLDIAQANDLEMEGMY